MTESRAVDIAAEQVVVWLMEEGRLDRHNLVARASRSYATGPVTGGKARWLSEEDREDVSEIVEVGLLEVAPRKMPHRWRLLVRVADDIGPRLPEDEPVPEGEEEIDLQTFYDEFVRPDRGMADVWVEAEGSSAMAEFGRVFGALLRDEHSRRGTAPARKRAGPRHRR